MSSVDQDMLDYRPPDVPVASLSKGSKIGEGSFGEVFQVGGSAIGLCNRL